jgi:hypothetical protein
MNKLPPLKNECRSSQFQPAFLAGLDVIHAETIHNAYDDHALPIMRLGSHSAIWGKTNRMTRAKTRAERKGTTPL